MAIQLSLSMPLEEVMTFRKVAKAYFALIEVLAHQHMVSLAACDSPTFAHLARSLEVGRLPDFTVPLTRTVSFATLNGAKGDLPRQ